MFVMKSDFLFCLLNFGFLLIGRMDQNDFKESRDKSLRCR